MHTKKRHNLKKVSSLENYYIQSPNNPAEPRIPIIPLTTKADKRSPFYNENSDEIIPLARLIFKRKQVVTQTCKKVEEYQREAFNITNTSEDEEYKDRRRHF